MTDILKHLDLNSADGTQLNLDALYQIAPSAFTEVRDDKTGEISRKVNFEVLRRLLGDHVTDGDGEMYQFTWVGKNAARAEAAKPTDKTLRPVVEDSVDWDNTKNIYIEGDNLEVLKLLQRSYVGKVKMIYIDPLLAMTLCITTTLLSLLLKRISKPAMWTSWAIASGRIPIRMVSFIRIGVV